MGQETGPGSETEGRTRQGRGWKLSRRNVGGIFAGLGALLAVLAIAGSGLAPEIFPAQATHEEWSTISLNFGANPVSQNLAIQFGRVAYIDQPTQYNTSGFTGANLVGNGAFIQNTSGYGVYQWNSTANQIASANYPVANSLGANVSYIFTDQRVALNGTGGTWSFGISEASQTSAPASSGNVSDGSAAAAQNVLWVQSTYSSGNYTFAVGDFEFKHGGYQTYTSTSFAASVKVQRLTFFEIYAFMAAAQTVVSIVNTTNEVALGSVTVHPVLDGNLSKVADLTDQVTQTSSVEATEIIDNTYLVDHNTFAGVPGAQGAVGGFAPLTTGALAIHAVTSPFDPATTGHKVNYTATPTTSSSFSSVNASLSAFSAVTNSSSPGSETSSALNASLIVNSTSKASIATSKQSLTTWRAAGESIAQASTGTLYVNSWTPATLQAQVWSFLTGTISASTGIPAADVEVQSYLITNVTVTSTFSTQAASTIHDYLATAIPGMLTANHLALVNQGTGAVDAGADIGDFLSASGQVYVPHASGFDNSQIYDPVNGVTYSNPIAAGFPKGSYITSAGEIGVPDQAAFLGFNAQGAPEFGPGACFIVCLGGLSGAAQAVSNFASSAASTVQNAVTSTANTIQSDVIQPVSGSLATDMGGLSTDISQAVGNVMPVMGATTGNIGASVSSGIANIGNSLHAVANSLGSGSSGAAGAILGGVNSLTNTVYHIGASAGSAVSNAIGGVTAGATQLENTVGGIVGTAQAVISPFFAQAGNDVVGGLSATGRSLASLGGSIAGAGMSALDTVGHAVTTGAGGLWSLASNAFGALGSAIVSGARSVLGLSGSITPVNWVTGLGGSISTLVIVVVIIVIVVIGLLVAFLLMRRHRRRKSGHQLGAESRGSGGRKSFHRRHHRRSGARS